MQTAAVSYNVMIAVVDMDQGIIVQKWNSSLRCNKLLTSVKGDQPFMSTYLLHTEHMLAGVSGKHTVVLSLMQIGINKSAIILGQAKIELSILWLQGGTFAQPFSQWDVHF